MLRNFARQGSVVAALLLVTASVAFAAKPVPTSTSSISLAPLSAAATIPSYGQNVTFNVSTTATTQPFVHLRCSQNKTLVYEQWTAWNWGAYGTQWFYLGGTTAGTGGAADCTATLEDWDNYGLTGKYTTLASTTFHVNA
jgi:hypothetical protein